MQRVKLQIQQITPDKTYVDIFEGKDFGDFVLVSINMNSMPQEELQMLHNAFQEAVADGRKVIVADNSLDLQVYGFKEEAKMIESGTVDEG